jgi:hypothetical protein
MANPNWKAGTSGNPNGRPKKDRALTTLLERAGGVMVEIDGARISGRRLMARQVWEGITTGVVSFPDGKKLSLSPQDWKDFVKWAYGHIDGPPPTAIDLNTPGELKVLIEYANKNEEGESNETV